MNCYAEEGFRANTESSKTPAKPLHGGLLILPPFATGVSGQFTDDDALPVGLYA